MAAELRRAGEPTVNLDALKAQAVEYEAQLLSMIDSSFPGGGHARELLEQQGRAALVVEIFDGVADKANLLSPTPMFAA